MDFYIQVDSKGGGGGMFLFSGCTNWDLTGRKTAPKGGKPGSGRNLWLPHRFSPLSGVKVRYVASGCTAAHNVIITETGSAFVFGK